MYLYGKTMILSIPYVKAQEILTASMDPISIKAKYSLSDIDLLSPWIVTYVYKVYAHA